MLKVMIRLVVELRGIHHSVSLLMVSKYKVENKSYVGAAELRYTKQKAENF